MREVESHPPVQTEGRRERSYLPQQVVDVVAADALLKPIQSWQAHEEELRIRKRRPGELLFDGGSVDLVRDDPRTMARRCLACFPSRRLAPCRRRTHTRRRRSVSSCLRSMDRDYIAPARWRRGNRRQRVGRRRDKELVTQPL